MALCIRAPVARSTMTRSAPRVVANTVVGLAAMPTIGSPSVEAARQRRRVSGSESDCWARLPSESSARSCTCSASAPGAACAVSSSATKLPSACCAAGCASPAPRENCSVEGASSVSETRSARVRPRRVAALGTEAGIELDSRRLVVHQHRAGERGLVAEVVGHDHLEGDLALLARGREAERRVDAQRAVGVVRARDAGAVRREQGRRAGRAAVDPLQLDLDGRGARSREGSGRDHQRAERGALADPGGAEGARGAAAALRVAAALAARAGRMRGRERQESEGERARGPSSRGRAADAHHHASTSAAPAAIAPRPSSAAPATHSALDFE